MLKKHSHCQAATKEAEARPIMIWKWEEEAEWKTSLASTFTFEKNLICAVC